MRTRRWPVVFVAMFFAPILASAEEVAGRVLVATGDVVLVRGAARIAARHGTELRAGDLLELGAQANAQIRLTDDSIIALRPDTTFRIAEYAFQNRKPEEQRSFFELARGGMRTVTGIIARANQKGYGVVTPTATVGIRGTHYVLYQAPAAGGKTASARRFEVASAGNDTALLAQAAASPASGPLFGSVTDGAIAVINKAGEFVFGADQYFRVDGPDVAPQRLIAPPAELAIAARPTLRPKPAAAPDAPADKPAAEKPAAPQPAAATGGESAPVVAQTGLGGTTGDTRVSSSVASPSAPIVLNPTVVLPTEQATTAGVSTLVQPTTPTGTKLYRLDGSVVLPAIINGESSQVTVEFITLGVNLGLGVARIRLSILDDTGGRISVAIPTDIPVVISGGEIVFSGYASRADFPFNQFAFRCQKCGPGGTLGFLDEVAVFGTISGSTATLTFAGISPEVDGIFSATLTERTPPNTLAAATTVPRLGGGVVVMVANTFGVQTDASGRPTLLNDGLQRAAATAAPVTVGSDPAAGDLKWGYWPNANFRDVNYQNLTATNQPWIIGQFPNAVPVTLGSSVSYTPVGAWINNGFATLNSASFTANFVNRTMTINLDVTRTSGELNRFILSGSSSFSPITATFGAAFSSLACIGPCTSGGNPLGGSFGGFFSGPNAEGAGVAFTAGYGVGNGVNGVVAFRR